MDLKEKFQKVIVPKLMKEFKIDNPWAVPRVTKVIVNIGLKDALEDKGILEKTSEWLVLITGQKPKFCRAKKSIAEFKLRAGDPIGLMVTLRRNRMYDFLEKLFNITFPRVKDFQGLSIGSFDGGGNYTLGLGEQIVFPEIDAAKIEKIRGLEIVIVTNAKNDEQAKRLLELLGMPFTKKEAQLGKKE